MSEGLDQFALNEEYRRLAAWRWPDGRPRCPRCQCEKLYFLTTRQKFKCSDPGCHHQFSITSGTILHAPKVSARKLLIAIEAIATNPNTTAAEIMRQTDMSYRGAHYLAARIRDSL